MSHQSTKNQVEVKENYVSPGIEFINEFRALRREFQLTPAERRSSYNFAIGVLSTTLDDEAAQLCIRCIRHWLEDLVMKRENEETEG